MINISKKLIRSSHYLVFSAGVLLQAHSAFASDPIGDAQNQARALLDPPAASHVISVETGTSVQVNNRVAPHADAQELARALLLGQSNESGAAKRGIVRDSKAPGTRPSSAQTQLAYSDPQEAAHRMILGIGERTVASTHLAVSERR
jgi:hypothetical protein